MEKANLGLRAQRPGPGPGPQKLGGVGVEVGGGITMDGEAAAGGRGLATGRQVGSGGVIYEEGKKLSDILGANAFPAQVRVVLAATGQGIFELGTIVFEDGSGVYYLANATDFATQNKGIGIVATRTNTGDVAVPADQVSMEIFESGSFQRLGLLQSATDPIPPADLRDFMRIHGLYIEG